MEQDEASHLLRRADAVRIYEVDDRMVVLAGDGNGHSLSGSSAALARAVLELFESPHPRSAALPHVATLAGGRVEHPQVVEDVVQLLLDAQALERVAPRAGPMPRAFGHRPCRVVLGLTGAVATMYTPALVQALQMHGCSVRVAATHNALRFVQPEALQALTHHPVVTGLWPGDDSAPVPHLHLARWADAVLVCPASATTISRLATADHDCIVSATALATRAPVLVVPSMNPAMYGSPAVQRNLAQLVRDGIHVAHPARGHEMADAPQDRKPELGAAPPPRVIVALLHAIVKTTPRAATPCDAADWDAVYRHRGDPPWHADDLDDDIAEALTRAAAPPASLLDIGTGLGSIALACARRGYRVVATDLSTVALDRAHASAPEVPVVWLQDDVTATNLRTTFDVVIDRGCLHLLPDDEARGYARSIARLVAPSGTLVIKTLDGPTAAARGATAYTEHDLQALLGDAFSLRRCLESTLPGPGEAPAARLFELVRTG